MRVLRDFDIRPALTLDAAKAVCLVEHDEDDAAIEGLIAQVTYELCTRANIALRNETITVGSSVGDILDCDLPIGPLVPANMGGVSVLLDGVDVTGQAVVMVGPRPNVSMSVVYAGESASITYVAGFGDDIADVPQAYRTALAQQVAWLYDGDDERRRIHTHSPAFARAVSMSGRVGIS